MTSMDITYEDGLRLSELYGQLASDQYVLDNLFASVLPDVLLIMLCIAVPAAFGLTLYAWDVHEYCRGWSEDECAKYTKKVKRLTIATLVIIVAVFVAALLIGMSLQEIYTNRDIASVQAQIDAIEARYA